MIEGIIHKGLVFVNRKKGFGLIFLSVGMGVFLFRAGCGFLPPQPAFVLDASSSRRAGVHSRGLGIDASSSRYIGTPLLKRSTLNTVGRESNSRLVGLNDFHDSLLTRPASSNFAGREIIVLLQKRPAITDPRAAEFNPRDCGAIDIQANLSPTRPVRRTAGREIYSRWIGICDIFIVTSFQGPLQAEQPRRAGTNDNHRGDGIWAEQGAIPNRPAAAAGGKEASGEFNRIPAHKRAGFFSQTGRPIPPGLRTFPSGGPRHSKPATCGDNNKSLTHFLEI